MSPNDGSHANPIAYGYVVRFPLSKRSLQLHLYWAFQTEEESVVFVHEVAQINDSSLNKVIYPMPGLN